MVWNFNSAVDAFPNQLIKSNNSGEKEEKKHWKD
ncbi:hypothetical protein T11_783 [Trichinella zimbabwensis]|uniref:Uncharacterized protein n=1 Tax=Trichinella zimbabwensis TaxID=268475 RepID=A0A0V1GGG1_9BILA|nr:hypothetical protein T11_783 [Trichinella zimbabwensis]